MVKIRLGQIDAGVGTALELFGEDTRIKFDSELFKKLAEFSEGSPIKFTGKLIVKADALDYFHEQSLTEGGSMNDPVFSFVFEDVNKLK